MLYTASVEYIFMPCTCINTSVLGTPNVWMNAYMHFLFACVGLLEESRGPSGTAVYHRVRRLCEKKKSGRRLVPEEVATAFFAGGDSQNDIIQQYLDSGCDKDHSPIITVWRS